MANLHVEESPLARHVQGEHVMPSIMSCRQAAELDHAFERNGWSPQEVKLLSSGSLLAEVRKVMLGNAEIKVTKHIIDCDAAPFVPKDWKVEEHIEGGQFKFKELLVLLFLTEDQQDDKNPQGHKVREDLAKELPEKLPLNANVLDYLIIHQELIPEYWKGRDVFFWGTVYRHAGGRLFVRFLSWDVDKWGWGGFPLDCGWDVGDRAALRIG